MSEINLQPGINLKTELSFNGEMERFSLFGSLTYLSISPAGCQENIGIDPG